MSKSMLPTSVHLVGIGGAGMNAIAHYLLDLNIRVSGSDIQHNQAISALSERGCVVFPEHDAANIINTDLVVYSDAIPHYNPEIIEATKQGIPVTKRAGFLQRLGANKTLIHVAGSHGKTTTAAMVATLLMEAGLDPSFIFGADVIGLGNRRARASAGNLMVTEACEAFSNLSHYTSDYAVITNIDDDHLEHYGDQAALDSAFSDFAARVAKKGVVFVNGDDPGIKRLANSLPSAAVSFGIESGNNFSASELALSNTGSRFSVLVNGRHLGSVFLPLPGRHMVENALGCIALCHSLGLDFQIVAGALAEFKTVSRRWNVHGIFGGIQVIEDFAHHPTELRANLETARLSLKPSQRNVLVFQPQLFSRTARLRHAYTDVIKEFDAAFLLEVDGAGENPVNAKGTELIMDHLVDSERPVCFQRDIDDMADSLQAFLKPGDIVLLAGGADIPAMTELLVARLSQPDRCHAANKGHAEVLRLLPGQRRTNTWRSSPTDHCHSLALIAQHFKSAPRSTAVSCGTRQITYAELDFISSILAEKLDDLSNIRGPVIALGLPPSIDHIACQISVLRAGAACLSLDEKLPSKRLAHMLKVAQAGLLITYRNSSIDKATPNIAKLYLGELSTQVGTQASSQDKFLLRVLKPRSTYTPGTAFICFTSGSTGAPKGIPISHDSFAALLPTAIERFQLSDQSKSIQNSSLAFDVSIAEVMLTLAAGGEIQIPGAGRPLLGRHLNEFINQNATTHLFATPSVLATLPKTGLNSLQVIISAGEVCPQSLADDLSRHGQLINAYGPAEATIYATAWDHHPDQAVNIGTPLSHVDAYILDSNNQLARNGEVGEICLGGVGVCDGYLTDGTTNFEKFISIQLEQGESVRVYKTGDIGRFRSDDHIEYIGRLDNQIKIRGNRVELEEIDAAMLKLGSIVDAVSCLDSSEQPLRICTYYTSLNSEAVAHQDISRALSAWLPEYMIPSTFVQVTEIALTATGKQDRHETARRNQFTRPVVVDFVPALGESQLKLVGLWQNALGFDDPIGQDHEFRFTGGDSIQYMMLMMDIETEFSLDLPPGFLSPENSLRTMARRIDELKLQAESPQAHPLFLNSGIYKQQKAFTADWPGRRHNGTSLIVSSGNAHADYQLFWCLQSGTELKNLAKEIGWQYCVHGMRSGHLVMEYSEANLTALSTYYAEQVGLIYPEGPVYLGGNCQGGQVAHAVALLLKKNGREVRLLILMEQASFPIYEDRLAFIYGKESYLNPHIRYDGGLSKYDLAYPRGYSLDFIPGSHGQYFREPNIFYLAGRIQSCIEEANIRVSSTRQASMVS